MKLIRATYMKQLTGHGCWLGESPVDLEAEVEIYNDEPTVFWTDACLAHLATLDLSGDELIGCEETVINAFEAAEHAEERKAMTAQQIGDQGFFDARTKETEAA